MGTVFKVPDTLTDKYHGTGYALAATFNGPLVDLVYLDDILSDFGGERDNAKAALTDPRLWPTVGPFVLLRSRHSGKPLAGWSQELALFSPAFTAEEAALLEGKGFACKDRI
ncbi:hypothetical protein [Polaromonas jejuensis]|uniref:Uncharacterized protein n=1 Tax=Polaromonas jejuensis TaxID=457502 RepID=A0ABW0QFG7_9BURK|nr:hypothetical protein [Polaromonas jejuensis]